MKSFTAKDAKDTKEYKSVTAKDAKDAKEYFSKAKPNRKQYRISNGFLKIIVSFASFVSFAVRL